MTWKYFCGGNLKSNWLNPWDICMVKDDVGDTGSFHNYYLCTLEFEWVCNERENEAQVKRNARGILESAGYSMHGIEILCHGRSLAFKIPATYASHISLEHRCEISCSKPCLTKWSVITVNILRNDIRSSRLVASCTLTMWLPVVGSVKSLMSLPCFMSHASTPAAVQDARGLTSERSYSCLSGDRGCQWSDCWFRPCTQNWTAIGARASPKFS
jgi:hypothetical protein